MGVARPHVLVSLENSTHDRCVDVFRRADGTFGFEEYRLDPEDMGRWTRTGGFGGMSFDQRQQAEAAAEAAVAWLSL